jgi:hypothetical protein
MDLIGPWKVQVCGKPHKSEAFDVPTCPRSQVKIPSQDPKSRTQVKIPSQDSKPKTQVIIVACFLDGE